MKILVISDTHGINHDLLVLLLKRLSPLDLIIHAGDIETALEDFLSMTGNTPVQIVSGNMDYALGAPANSIFNIGNSRIFLTHGHRYGVKSDVDLLLKAAKEHNADIAIFGHSHKQYHNEKDGVILLNPGSFSRPANLNGKPAYAIGMTDFFGKPHWRLCEYSENNFKPEFFEHLWESFMTKINPPA